MKLAIVDIDGVIACTDARFALAHQAKVEALTGKGLLEHTLFDRISMIESAKAKKNGLEYWEGEVYRKEDMKVAENSFYRVAFTPELTTLDTLIDGVVSDMEHLRNASYDILLLTSRPENMREATVTWLDRSEIWPDNMFISFIDWLIMKPKSFEWTKTVTWKAGKVEELVRLFRADALLFCDDEQAHQDAIAALDLPCDIVTCESLQEAVASA